MIARVKFLAKAKSVVGEWVGRLTPNERRLIMAAGALAGALGLTLFVVTPLRSAHQSARLAYESAVALRDEVRTALAVRGSAPHPATGDVRGVVTRAAAARGLVIARMSPADGGLSVRIDSANPATLYAWLASLDREGRIPVVRAAVRLTNDPAAVQADIVLGAGGAP
jgi:type II secretory pathway component PulM